MGSNPAHGEVYSIQHYVIKFVSDLRQVGGFLWELQFPPPNWPPWYNWNIVESGIKHHKSNQTYSESVKYRITSNLMVETDSITASLVGRAAFLMIMYVETNHFQYQESVIDTENITRRDQRKNSQVTNKKILYHEISGCYNIWIICGVQ